jgi:hypothetical protein
MQPMIRTYLAEGDRAGEAVIIEGLPGSTYEEADGRRVALATVGMRTYCHACKQTGFICPSEPRLPSRAENGKEHALSGDFNVCACQPSPKFWAQRNMTQTITSEDIARMREVYESSRGEHTLLSTAGAYDDRFILRCPDGRALSSTTYALRRENGTFEYGKTDGGGHTHLLASVASAENIDIYLAG